MIRSRLFALHLSLLAMSSLAGMSPAAAQAPVAVRNDVPRTGQQEVIMMRHAYIEKGSYETWYEASRSGVWPWYERLGSRILGDFQIIYPEGKSEAPELDEALRFARYASYEHWQATREAQTGGDTGGSVLLAGNGGLRAGMEEGIADRGQVSKGSKGGVFLRGHLHETHPIYLPGTGERFERASGGLPDPDASSHIAVRLDRAQPGDEILVLEYAKVRKRSFEEVHALTRDGVWPYLEKIGARPVGQWQVAYLPNSTAEESDAYDEVYLLTRYASYAHYVAVRDRAVLLGGNGPDFEALREAQRRIGDLTLETSRQFMRGKPYGSPPIYAPPMNERYRPLQRGQVP